MNPAARRLLRVPVALAAASQLSCFGVAPLAACSQQDGLHIPYHVCMPPARPRISLSEAPRDIVVGDFDGDKFADLAVLSDTDHVVVYTKLAEDLPTTKSLHFGSGEVAVSGFVASPFLDGGHGDDLIAWIDRPQPLVGQLSVLPNGGNNFAAAPILDEIRGNAGGLPLGCFAPSNGLALAAMDSLGPSLLVTACLPNLALGAADVDGVYADGLPDVVAIPGAGYPEQGSLALVSAKYKSVGPLESASLRPDTAPYIVFAHRPTENGDAALAIVDTTLLDFDRAIPVELGQGSVDQLRSADLDGDGDTDILAFHREQAGFSVIRQQPPKGAALAFGEPEFYTLAVKLSAVALGDFTGDGGLDIAVAHSIDNSSLDGITIFALDLAQPGGPLPYNSELSVTVKGAIVALKTLDLDLDGLADLVAAVRDGSRGSLRFFVNRSPGDS